MSRSRALHHKTRRAHAFREAPCACVSLLSPERMRCGLWVVKRKSALRWRLLRFIHQVKFRIFENWQARNRISNQLLGQLPAASARRQPPRRAVLPQCTRSSPRLLPQAPLPTAMLTRRPTQVYGLPASAAGGAAPPATVRLAGPRRPRPARARLCAYSTTSGAFLQQRADRLRAPAAHTTGIGGVHRGLAPAMGTKKIQQGRRRPARRRPHGRRARRPGSGTTSSRGERVLSSRAPRIHRAGPRRSAASTTRPAAGHCPPRRAAPRRARGRGKGAPPARAPSTSLSRTRRRRTRWRGLPRRATPSSASYSSPRSYDQRPRGLFLWR